MAYQEQLEAKIKENPKGKRAGLKINEAQSELHNRFNIICLPIVIAANWYHLYSCYTQPVDPDPFTWMSMSRRSHNNSWPICWWVFATYICVDTLWVALFPRCVANANTILLHHALCIGGWWLGTQWSELECDVSSSLIVEFNTWLLILKRKFVEDSFWKRFIKMLDDVSWVLLRLCIFPCVCYQAWGGYFYQLRHFPDSPLGGYLNTSLYGVVSSTLLMAQNMQWTRDKYFKFWFRNSKDHSVDNYMNKMHDYFNIFFLPGIVACWCWHQYDLFSAGPDETPIAGTLIWTRAQVPDNCISYSVLWTYTWWYFVVDSAWIIMYPESVASPRSIIIHHIVCVLGWHLVLAWPRWEVYVTSGLEVELNTWLLIAKRQFRGQRILSILENVTWPITRLVAFPIVGWNAWMVYLHMVKHYPNMPLGGYINTGLHGAVSVSVVVVQNFYWTYNKWFAIKKKAHESKGL